MSMLEVGVHDLEISVVSSPTRSTGGFELVGLCMVYWISVCRFYYDRGARSSVADQVDRVSELC